MNTEMLDKLTKEDRTAYTLLEKAGLLEEKENMIIVYVAATT